MMAGVLRWGGAVTVMMEGTRPLLMEVQALCSRSAGASAGGAQQVPARRNPMGVNYNRFNLCAAMLPLRLYHCHLAYNSCLPCSHTCECIFICHACIVITA